MSQPAIAPQITYPEHLPVSARRDEIKEAIERHQVVVVAGETGSGKTTQLPKMCLELGLAEHGMIGHTQPRRIAARSVAERLAHELDTEIGRTVGYQVRFTAETSKQTQVKVMTDGILLAEIQQDRMLSRYSVIIIDEAHERSLNIDFLLGYLQRLLPQRPDLKVIITSATIDPDSFARHFGRPLTEQDSGQDRERAVDGVIPAPVIEVSGRTFPVEIRYRPLSAPAEADDEYEETDDAEETRDPVDAVCDAVDELSRETPGDILVFFPGEREIRDAAEALAPRVAANRRLAGTEILPLYGRLSMAEQHRVFSTGTSRRIVLATNVAETSLTVPGIKYVIDTGTARISRYSHRTKVQRLPIERISQASANQRSGRSGRTSDGIAIRLYSEEDFASRPEFTDPEILRTNLAAVILQMCAMGVARTPADVADFPFLQPPDTRQVTDGATLLTELGALNSGQPERDAQGRTRTFPKGTITPVGRKLARLPVDPRLGRMILEAGARGCVREVMVLAAALTIQDPRERPTEQRAAADEQHARFTDANSDFTGLLNLWAYLREQQKALSGNQFRRMCRAEHINYLRVREWQDLVQQLRQLAKSVDISVSAGPVDPVGQHEPVHRSILTGLLSHIGSWDERRREYAGARNTRFAVFPGSALFKKRHPFVMAAELVETSRLWARMVARIEPEWAEEAAGSLAKHTYNEPHWSRRAGSVVAREKVTLFGVTLIPDRAVRYGRIDPGLSRELFIRHALVEGDWRTRHRFYARNQQALAEVEELESRLRRRDLRISDEDLFSFYDERVPAHVVSERHFDSWWKKARHQTPELLDISTESLLAADAEELDTDQFPTTFHHPTDGGGIELDLEYQFNPAAGPQESDGITVTIPVLLLNQMDPERFRWLVPGLRTELVTALIRSLPKAVRKNFVPAPDVARTAVEQLDQEADPLHDDLLPALELTLRRMRGVVIPPDSWNLTTVPDHLRMDYRVVDSRGAVVGAGPDLAALQDRLAQANRTAIAESLAQAGGSDLLPDGGTPVPAPAPGGRGPGTGAGRRGGKNAAGAAGSVPGGTPGDRAGRGAGPSSGAHPGAGTSAVAERHGMTAWEVGDLPRRVESTVRTGQSVQQITGYPALVAETLPDGSPAAGLTVMRTPEDQRTAHRGGVGALLLAQVPSPQRYVLDHLDNREKLTFTQNPHGSVDQLVADCTRAAIDRLLPEDLPYTEAEFRQLFERVRAELIDTVFAVTAVVERILSRGVQVRKALKGTVSLAMAPALNDIKSQLGQLVFPGFVATTGWAHLQHLPRYLEGMLKRIEKLQAGGAVQRDARDMAVVQELEDAFDAAVQQVRARRPGQPIPAALDQVRWMIEELRVSYFAQELGTAVSVSEKRVRQALKAAAG
ncbi:ATP-dependent RNA helicase HrpA [Micrococcus terreus]|uniref:ATP-dependent RNA helicase HrpA n=1 Tax=Micrococcus terreus TaxID=574650 RepID=UPI00254E23C6|nr:ATP-dependent RNA helicase HrpA [Micrococcus terreus]MDK7702209.1 ATP-dependent RNA helicase HrpA [Micrococcus terreus]WOO97939.1 ATP-dependent RNA helicase HrpA [Micrococcus terreus]